MIRVAPWSCAIAAAAFAFVLPRRVQAQGSQAPSGGAEAPVGGTGALPETGSLTTIPTYAPVAPRGATPGSPPDNSPIGGGNATESSARAVAGDKEDSFDLGSSRAGGGAVHGDDNSPIFRSRPSPLSAPPSSHHVSRGDTLWAICDTYFRNPYQWPKVWSYNPQIKNPNWIYPGDEVHLKNPGEGGESPPSGAAAAKNGRGKLIDRRKRVPGETVFLRDEGWIHDDADDVWGEVTGAATDNIFLSNLDEVYITVKPGHDVQAGQELTLFRTRDSDASGAVVQVLGTVKVDSWNENDRVGRAEVIETVDVIERGAKVGAVTRSFRVVPAVTNEVDLQAHVSTSLHPNAFFGQNQVVFIDKGESAGLKPGNRLFVVRRGDAWRHTLVAAEIGNRVSAEDDRPMPASEKTPGTARDDAHYPEEVVAEMRVVDVRKDSAACLVTQSKSEIELNDTVVARKGY